jgi:hypothetical protein
MKRTIHFNKETGLVNYLSDDVKEDLYIDGGEANGSITIQGYDNWVIGDILTTLHWTGSEVGVHAAQPDKDYVWDKTTFSYVLPDNYLDTLKTTNTVEVNRLAWDKITVIYPLYKQLNVARTSEAGAMNTWIDSIRALAQTAKLAISVAPSIIEIRVAITTFTDNLQLA